jgi:glycogen debranching enzyme
MKNFKRCKEIAVKGLRQCYGPYGIYAGLHQFKQYWARDSMWASLGALELGDCDVVRKNLQVLLDFEETGKIPLRMSKRWIPLGSGLKPNFYSSLNKNHASDNNSLFLIALSEYYNKEQDKKFFIKNLDKIYSVINYLLKRANGLIKEGEYASWMDGISKKGYLFYSNILLYMALRKLIKIKEVRINKAVIKELKKSINEVFWNGEYFIDWKGNNDMNYFSTFSNLIAIYFDFANKSQKKKIFDFIEKKGLIMEDGSIIKSHPNYSERFIRPIFKVIGMKGYCTEIRYPWMSFFYFLCLKKEGLLKDKSRKRLERLCERIIRDKTIYECYSPDNKPYQTILYKAEHPFAWGCSFAVLLFSEKN